MMASNSNLVIGSEVSHYALDITSLSELEETQKKDIKILKVMHCNQLTSLNGADAFPNLIELNCSSNQIHVVDHVFGLKKLVVLDLSCNNISSVPDLSTLSSLESLNLSHNRITDLQGLSHVNYIE